MLHHTKQQFKDPLHVNKLLLGYVEHSYTVVQLCHILVEVAAAHFKLVQHAQSQHIQLVGTLHFLKLLNFKYNSGQPMLCTE